MSAHDLDIKKEITIAGIPFSDTKKTMQQYYHEEHNGLNYGSQFDATFAAAAQKLKELPQEIASVDAEMKLHDINSVAYKELAEKKKNLDNLKRGLTRNLPRHTDPNVGLDASVAALVCIGVRKENGTVEPHFMAYDSARKDPTWAGKSLIAINGKIEISEMDPRETMCREIKEELLNSNLGLQLSAKAQQAEMNQAPHYSTSSIAIDRIASGQDCYLNQTTFIFGGIYDEDELNRELKEVNASMERLLGNDAAPASRFIKHIPAGPQPATACKEPALAETEILLGLDALLDWYDKDNLAVRCPLIKPNYDALTELRSNIKSKKLDLSTAKDVADVKQTFEKHVYCYTEAKKARLLSKNEFYTVAKEGKVTTSHGEEISMPGFSHRPLGVFLAKQQVAETVVSTQKENSNVYGRPGSPALYQPVPAVRNAPSFEQWLSSEIDASISKPAPACI